VYCEFFIKEPDDLGDQAQTRFRADWQDEKDWLCTVGFLPTDDPEARLYSADIVGYLVGYPSISSNFVRGLRSSISRWRLWIKRWKVRRIARASTSREPAPRAQG
jgi:hypothetical protein